MIVWLQAYPSSVEVDCGCIASLEVVRLREEFGTPSGLKILLGEDGDVELGARTSEHIIVFAFDPLPLNSLSLSLLFVQSIIHSFISYCLHLCLALFHIVHLYMLGLLVCASLILNHKSFI